VGESADPGMTFYQNRCAECHGMDGAAKISGAADLTVSTMNEDALKKIIEEGKNAMPPFKLLIESDSLLQQTIDYVITLRKK
jgi:cytochrome c5